MKNYISIDNGKRHVFFEDRDPTDVTRALGEAEGLRLSKAPLAAWRQAATIPLSSIDRYIGVDGVVTGPSYRKDLS